MNCICLNFFFSDLRCGHPCCKIGLPISPNLPTPDKKSSQMINTSQSQNSFNNKQSKMTDNAHSQRIDKPSGFVSLLQRKKNLFCQDTLLNNHLEDPPTSENLDSDSQSSNFCADFQLDYDDELDELVSIEQANFKTFEQKKCPTQNNCFKETRCSEEKASAASQIPQLKADSNARSVQENSEENSSNRFQSYTTPHKNQLFGEIRTGNKSQIKPTPNRQVQIVNFPPQSLFKELEDRRNQNSASHSDQSNNFGQSTIEKHNNSFDQSANQIQHLPSRSSHFLGGFEYFSKDTQYQPSRLGDETPNQSGIQDQHFANSQSHCDNFLDNQQMFHTQNNSSRVHQTPSSQTVRASHLNQEPTSSETRSYHFAAPKSVLGSTFRIRQHNRGSEMPFFNQSVTHSENSALRISNESEFERFKSSSAKSVYQAQAGDSFSIPNDLQCLNSSMAHHSSRDSDKVINIFEQN